MKNTKQVDSLYNKKEAHNKEIWEQIKYHELLLLWEFQFGTTQETLDRFSTIKGLINMIWE